MAVKNFVFVNENQFTWRSGQNYTLSYYQLTFSEPNRLIVSVIRAWFSDKSNFNNYKTVKNTSSMKQNNWTTSCTQNEAKRARETLIWLESVTPECDRKSDRKCSTWCMRRRFPAVSISFTESALPCQPERVADQKDRGLWERDWK